jgi:hypothetical protein
MALQSFRQKKEQAAEPGNRIVQVRKHFGKKGGCRMRRLAIAVMGLGLLCTGAQAGGLGVFGSYWNPSDGDETFGAGAKLRAGAGPFYFGVRGTYYDDISEDVGDDDDDLQVIPVDVSAGLQFNISGVSA